MNIAFLCLLIAIILPYIWAGYAKSPAMKSKNYDNNSPRLLLAQLEGACQRANWAQQNAFEALPGFIAAVLVAHLAGVGPDIIDMLAVIFIAARMAHGICYIKDAATLRSLAWTMGMLCVVGLFVAAMI